MQKTKEVVKVEDYKIAKAGHYVLNFLKSSWGEVEAVRPKTVLGEEGIKFEKQKVVMDTPMKRINKNYPTEIFYQFASKVKKEDEARVQGLIERNIFDVSIANKSFSSLEIAINKKIKPKSWGESGSFEMPSINTVAIYKGEDYIEDVIFQMLVKISKRFGKRSDLDTDQISELVDEIVINYRSYTITDLKYLFHHLESKSKKLFSLDYQIVLQLLDEGVENKLSYWDNHSSSNHKHLTSREKEARQKQKPTRPNAEGQSIEANIKEALILGDTKKLTPKEAKQKPKFKKPKNK